MRFKKFASIVVSMALMITSSLGCFASDGQVIEKFTSSTEDQIKTKRLRENEQVRVVKSTKGAAIGAIAITGTAAVSIMGWYFQVGTAHKYYDKLRPYGN